MFGADAEFRHGPLNGLQDRIVPAARAPAHFLVSLEILDAKLGHLVHARFSSMAASISAMRKGWPEILFKGLASTRYWSRKTVFNCPVFISGTNIRSSPFSNSPRFLVKGQIGRT